MAVHYADFRDIDISDYDALVVGAGFAGAVTARQLSQLGQMRVLVIEKRSHIAGNMYDELDQNGILVHRYGPHIFHTDDQRVFAYLRSFDGFSTYKHRVLADVNGDYVPVPFNKKSLEMAFGERAEELLDKLVDAFGDECSVTINELRAQDDPDLAEVAQYVYDNIFLGYTQKQWGQRPEEVDPSVVGRVPVRISYDDRYFQDKYQGMPMMGWTKLFERMLDWPDVTVCLETDAESVFDLVFESIDEDAGLEAIKVKGQAFEGPIIYTGPLDELFLSRFGRLPYRSLDFEYETVDEEYALPCGTVNYTVSEDYTRITEYKHITLFGPKDKTTLCKEYPKAYADPTSEIPYYPIISEENRSLYERYLRLTETLPNFYPVGRLAEYRYYDMDVVIHRAFDLVADILSIGK